MKKERNRDRRKLDLAEGVEVNWGPGYVQFVACGYEGWFERRRVPDSVVYVLFDGDEIVYVGQSTNLYHRLWFHAQDGKQFDSWARVEVPEDVRLDIEKALIYHLDPKYNDRCADSHPGPRGDPDHVEYLRSQHEKLPIR